MARGAGSAGWDCRRVAVVASFVALCLVSASVAGCAREEPWRHTRVYPDRLEIPSDQPAPLVYCTDAVGHRAGAAPFIFGGTCLCNPTLAVFEAYQRDGLLMGEWSVDALRSAYAARGIATVEQHERCNNLCRSGPHVVKGGRCLVPPTPGTLNHEEVITGRFTLTPWESRKVNEHGGPVPISSIE